MLIALHLYGLQLQVLVSCLEYMYDSLQTRRLAIHGDDVDHSHAMGHISSLLHCLGADSDLL